MLTLNGFMKHALSTIINEWNLLAERFNTHKVESEIHPDAAVNIHIGWPIFFRQIVKQTKISDAKKLNIMDFGCGTGLFCKEAVARGYNIIGVDRSEKMLEYASKKVPSSVKLYSLGEFESQEFLEKYNQHFDVITAMHVFEWIEEIESVISRMSLLLKKGGILMFAVFPKDHIRDSLVIHDLFEDFDSDDDPKFGYANFDGIRVPVFIKSAEEYDEIALRNGFSKELEEYPPYTSEFLKKYNWTASLYPEMAILVYRKL